VGELRGFHVTCDGRAPPERAAAWTEQDCLDWCKDVIASCEMTCIAGPTVHQHEGKIIGFAVIAESHVAVHLEPSTGGCFAECFSCKPFDVADFVRETIGAFGLTTTGAVHWRERGCEEQER